MGCDRGTVLLVVKLQNIGSTSLTAWLLIRPMPDEPKIPYGYKRVPTGERTQYRDGLWDGEKFVRLRKGPEGWPIVGDAVVIRRCIVEQTDLPLEP